MNANLKLAGCLFLLSGASCHSRTAETTVTPLATQTSAAFVFDVPALLDQSIDQIKQQLGEAKGTDTPNLTTNELERTYVKQGQKLIITYNTKNKKPESFFLVAPGPTEVVQNCNKLLAIGHLRLDNPDYTVDSLADDKDGFYLGIIVTKKIE